MRIFTFLFVLLTGSALVDAIMSLDWRDFGYLAIIALLIYWLAVSLKHIDSLLEVVTGKDNLLSRAFKCGYTKIVYPCAAFVFPMVSSRKTDRKINAVLENQQKHSELLIEHSGQLGELKGGVDKLSRQFIVLRDNDPIVRFTLDFDLQATVNRAYLDFFRLSSAEVEGSEWMQSAIHPEELKTVMDKWANAITYRHTYVNAQRLANKDGKYFHCMVKAKIGVDADDRQKFFGVVSILNECTDDADCAGCRLRLKRANAEV